MEAITVRPRNKKELTLIKTFLKALNLEIEEGKEKETEITNPVVLERLHKLHHDYKEENYITVDSKNIWESISSK